MKKIIALICMLIAVALSGSPAVLADSGATALDISHHAAQGVTMSNVGDCQTCHETSDQKADTGQRQRSPDATASIPNDNRSRWGIRPSPYYVRANWSPD